MKMRMTIITTLWIAALLSVAAAAIPPRNSDSPAAPPSVNKMQTADTMRVEGEKRFRANCGRCHAAPQKFPPRMMATILRHMRVRATITDEDMRLVLYYMTQ
jgi:mono/diheme cytochrome c family protein